jgi:hypothetical protein
MTTDTTQDDLERLTQEPGLSQTDSDLTHAQAVERFLKAATWITDVDIVQVTLMRHLAREIDAGNGNGALTNQLGVIARNLADRQVSGDNGVDEDEAFLNGE